MNTTANIIRASIITNVVIAKIPGIMMRTSSSS